MTPRRMTRRRDAQLEFIERYALVIAFVAVLVFFSLWSETSSTFLTTANVRTSSATRR